METIKIEYALSTQNPEDTFIVKSSNFKKEKFEELIKEMVILLTD